MSFFISSSGVSSSSEMFGSLSSSRPAGWYSKGKESQVLDKVDLVVFAFEEGHLEDEDDVEVLTCEE